MRRLVDIYCAPCDYRTECICAEDEVVCCPHCLSPMEQQWWARRRQQATVWDPSEWATVFKRTDGTYSFPMKADKPTPPGCERITIKSDAEMAWVEREAGVRSERRWYDKGSAAGFDDTHRGRPI
jgi:hypothetical protein